MTKTKLWLIQHQLSSSSPQRRLQAVRKLRASTDASAVKLLLQALRDLEGAVRTEAAAALGETMDRSVVKPLIEALGDPAEGLQEAAIQSLKRLGDPAAVPAILQALLQGTPGVQARAARALISLGWQPHSTEEQIQFFVATSQWKRAALFGAAAVQALAAVLAGSTYERRVAAANVLGEIGDASALKPLLAALSDSDAPVRSAAANALGRFGGVQVVSQLIVVLADLDRNVRAAVAGALGELGDPDSVEPLVQFLEDSEWEVRTAALGALGRLGDRRAVQPVAACLKDKEEEVRQQAAETLGRLGDASVLEPLVLAMVDEQSGVRQAAARSLSVIDSYWERSVAAHTLIPRIEAALRHNNAGVQYAASGLLRRLTGRMPSAAAHTDSERKTRSLVRILQEMLLDADAEVRLAAAESMGRLRWPVCAGALKTALDDSSDWVKLAAQEALAEIARAPASAPG